MGSRRNIPGDRNICPWLRMAKVINRFTVQVRLEGLWGCPRLVVNRGDHSHLGSLLSSVLLMYIEAEPGEKATSPLDVSGTRAQSEIYSSKILSAYSILHQALVSRW